MSSVLSAASADLWQLPERLRNLVEAELESGETISWVGQPSGGRFCLQSLPILLFAIPWTAFALFWMIAAAGFRIPNFQQGGDFFPLFGVPFVLIGLTMLSTPYWSARRARRTVYVVTDRRAIIFDGGWGTTIRSFMPGMLRDLQRKQFRDGSGNVIFERGFSTGKNRTTPDVGFLAIRDVQAVEQLVRRMAQKMEPVAGDPR